MQDVQGSMVKRESEDFLEVRENKERMGLPDWMGKRVFVDFLGKKEKKVIQDLRAARVPEVPLGNMGRRASQEILVIQDKTVTSRDKRAPKENKEDKVELDRKEHQAVLIPEEIGEGKANGGPQVPRASREIVDLKAFREPTDYKAHRGWMEFLAEKERREARGIKDHRALPGQWELKGTSEVLGLLGKKENLEFLEIQGQWGKSDREEDRGITASQAMVKWDEKE